MESQERKVSRGGARPGAGRKSKGTDAKTSTLVISGKAAEIEKIRQLAQESGKTTSRFLIELALGKDSLS